MALECPDLQLPRMKQCFRKLIGGVYRKLDYQSHQMIILNNTEKKPELS